MRRVRFERKLVNAFPLKTCCLAAAFLAFLSCSESPDSPLGRHEKSTIYVSVPAAGGNAAAMSDTDTKTIIGGEGLTEVFWSEKDRISFYYRPQETQEPLASAELGVYRIYPDETLFSGEITSSPDMSYDCLAVFPKPESVTENIAVFDLPATQNGLYDSSVDGTSCDIMVADPVAGLSLSGDGGAIPLSFTHKCHAFRIQVPEGRNLFGMDVKKLRVEFPVEVVGKLSVDMANPEAEAILEAGGAKTVWLDLTKVLKESETDSDEGIYAWIFTAPADIDGQVRFTAYSRENYSSGTISVDLKKTLQEGEITPVTLTVPEEPEYSSVTLKVGTNNLGEDYRTVTVRAPEGAVFRNGSGTVVFERNDAQEYSVEFYESVDGTDNLTPMKSGDLTVEFESEHAIVSGEPISLADFTWGETGRTFSRDVPYLLYEDFSGALDADRGDKTETLDAYNLSGWSASNYGIWGGQGVEIRAYAGGKAFGSYIDPSYGRIDSPFLLCLKSSDKISLKVSFDIGGQSSRNLYPVYAFGLSTESGSIEASDEVLEVEYVHEDAPAGKDFTQLPLHKIIDVMASNETRLSWRIDFRDVGTVFANSVYVYIDNIKVQIAPEE